VLLLYQQHLTRHLLSTDNFVQESAVEDLFLVSTSHCINSPSSCCFMSPWFKYFLIHHQSLFSWEGERLISLPEKDEGNCVLIFMDMIHKFYFLTDFYLHFCIGLVLCCSLLNMPELCQGGLLLSFRRSYISGVRQHIESRLCSGSTEEAGDLYSV